jgi:hypothetical protein
MVESAARLVAFDEVIEADELGSRGAVFDGLDRLIDHARFVIGLAEGLADFPQLW